MFHLLNGKHKKDSASYSKKCAKKFHVIDLCLKTDTIRTVLNCNFLILKLNKRNY